MEEPGRTFEALFGFKLLFERPLSQGLVSDFDSYLFLAEEEQSLLMTLKFLFSPAPFQEVASLGFLGMKRKMAFFSVLSLLSYPRQAIIKAFCL